MAGTTIYMDIDRCLQAIDSSDLDPDQSCSICHEQLKLALEAQSEGDAAMSDTVNESTTTVEDVMEGSSKDVAAKHDTTEENAIEDDDGEELTAEAVTVQRVTAKEVIMKDNTELGDDSTAKLPTLVSEDSPWSGHTPHDATEEDAADDDTASVITAINTSAMRAEHDDLVRVKCGHIFDRTCITNWLLTSDKCPTCATPILHLTPELTNWRELRLEMITELESDLDDDDIASLSVTLALYSLDFLARHTSPQAVPNKSTWWACVFFGHHPRAWVDGRGWAWVGAREELLRSGELSEEDAVEMRGVLGMVRGELRGCEGVKTAYGVRDVGRMEMVML